MRPEYYFRVLAFSRVFLQDSVTSPHLFGTILQDSEARTINLRYYVTLVLKMKIKYYPLHNLLHDQSVNGTDNDCTISASLFFIKKNYLCISNEKLKMVLTGTSSIGRKVMYAISITNNNLALSDLSN